jgi:photosystem II stability/assembly factor-like uncharacterized protein
MSFVLLAACSISGGNRPGGSGSPARSSSSPSASSLPSVPLFRTPSLTPTGTATSLSVLDTTWVSDHTGWVLKGGQCSGLPCQRIFHTVDGGATWDQVASPAPTPSDPTCPLCIDHLRLADTRIGYAWADQISNGLPNFYVTTDGGLSWRAKPAPDVIEDLEMSGRTAYRLVAGGAGCPGPCGVRLETATVGSDSWRRLPVPDVSEGKGDGLVVQGSRIYVLGFGNPAGGVIATTAIARSLDGGATWQRFHDPCGSTPTDEVDARLFAASPGGFFAVGCEPRLGQRPSFLISSSNAGTTYGPPQPLPVTSSTYLGALSAGSASSLLVMTLGPVTNTVFASHDRGSSWRATLSAPAPAKSSSGQVFAGFEDSLTARAAFATGPLWTTTDAGASWQRTDPGSGS